MTETLVVVIPTPVVPMIVVPERRMSPSAARNLLVVESDIFAPELSRVAAERLAWIPGLRTISGNTVELEYDTAGRVVEVRIPPALEQDVLMAIADVLPPDEQRSVRAAMLYRELRLNGFPSRLAARETVMLLTSLRQFNARDWVLFLADDATHRHPVQGVPMPSDAPFAAAVWLVRRVRERFGSARTQLAAPSRIRPGPPARPPFHLPQTWLAGPEFKAERQRSLNP